MFFGPLLFPASLVTWHLVTIIRGEEHFTQFENIARSRVLSSLTVLTKSCMQLTLQVTVGVIKIIITNIMFDAGHYNDDHLVQQ